MMNTMNPVKIWTQKLDKSYPLQLRNKKKKRKEKKANLKNLNE